MMMTNQGMPTNQAVSGRGRRRAITGFTLVELMVVIAIIGILASLLVVAVMQAIPTARRASIGFELSQLAAQLDNYKNDVGAFPPDFVGNHQQDVQAIARHVSVKFRNRIPGQDLDANQFNGLDPAEALVFWLRGFAQDPLRPVAGTSERTAYFDFKKERLLDKDGDGYPEYYPPKCDTPYIYYNSSTYINALAAAQQGRVYPVNNRNKPADGVSQSVFPYMQRAVDAPTKADFVNPDSFQLICAGLDNEFGKGGVFPVGAGYSRADRDNQCNFSEGVQLEDRIP